MVFRKDKLDAMTAPRYTSMPTFMRAPQVGDAAEVDLAMIGVPFDAAVTNRPGARHGPRESSRESATSSITGTSSLR